jgi:5-methyltetrahydropteroyltriglutamate--homocysteine methyltransferase
VERASREFSELDVIAQIGAVTNVGVGVIDVKNSYIEPPEVVAERIGRCLDFVSPERLSVSPDCGLSQTARWAAREKLGNLVAGANAVRAAR